MNTFTLTLIAAAAGSAAAFAPSQQGRASSAVEAKAFSDDFGAMAPLGLFDPLGLIEDGSQKKFDMLREYELTHGRVSMLAVTGYLVTAAGIRFPGAGDVPAGLKAFDYLLASKDGQNVLLQMLAFMAVATIVNRDAEWLDNEAEFVGDYRNGSLDFGWDKFDAETKLKKRKIELNNGRAAMMGIWGLVVHEGLGVSILPGNILP
ncbi:Chloroa_b-bind-domain-containing protein [Fragilariopsis cylindrus CCMP1102]|uniref:Chloroa_b-bind-domain-containing protein n=1 Tax=Fragilariopsis cylindrus CCMP1102 TaxID=635003 RepID=A0A1E7F9G5_9STRA|nr:Chloroa_b-bind-domain-containing protein [Fragilariopsis cylindrus CCMP1102]|eukprot:OEU14774.1 Chloroa_b-bind-domain-containing protein [Fragilariopsis cylindrus CCMP1102]